MTQQLVHMEAAIEGLHASTTQPLPFAPAVDVRAFLLRRDAGNLLLYSTTELDADAAAIEDLGGVSRHYLNHRHEAMFAPDWVPGPLFVHENERASIPEASHVRGTFSRRHALDHDFEVIPAPGHTLYLREGEWVAAVLDSSDRDSYVESLELIRELDFDVLVPWAATHGQPYYAATDRANTQRRIDTILDRVRRGEDY